MSLTRNLTPSLGLPKLIETILLLPSVGEPPACGCMVFPTLYEVFLPNTLCET